MKMAWMARWEAEAPQACGYARALLDFSMALALPANDYGALYGVHFLHSYIGSLAFASQRIARY